MEIRKRLTYQFSGAVALILLFTFLAIYMSFWSSRKTEFYDRLSSKAELVGQMLIDIDEIDLDVLRKIEENNPLNLANEKIIIYDSANLKIYSSDFDSTIVISRKLIREIRKQGEIHFAQGPFEICGLHYNSRNSRIVVFTAAVDIFGMRKISMLRNILVFVYFASLIFIFLIGRVLANRSLNPIQKIIKQVDEISIYNLDARLDQGNGKDEIAKLANTFNNMLQRLETSFKIQKTFIANASHELRNPLAVLTGQMEVVLMSDRSKKEYLKTLLSVYEDAVGINRLANDLLLLAQTSLDSISNNHDKVRIDDTLWHAVNEMNRRHPEFQISVNFSEIINDEDCLTVNGNEMLLKTAFLNLMENAYKYSDFPAISINVDFKGDQLIIEFKDKGIGIAEEELSLIFNPFYRSQNSLSKKGHGIGLTLVQNIANLHHGQVTVQSTPKEGSTFCFCLPIS